MRSTPLSSPFSSLLKLVGAGLLAGTAITAHADYQRQGIDSPERSLPVFYEALRDRMQFRLGWHDEMKDPVAWKRAGLAKARELMLPDGVPDKPFDARVVDEIDRGSYVARKVEFNISAESRALALVLVPKGSGPFPAALFLHDHGSKFDIGKEKFVQTWGDDARLQSSKEWAEKFFSGRFPGDELARRGYVVMSFDALGWGDRAVEGFRTDSQQALAANLFNLGTSFAGIIAQEDVRASQFLAAQDKVDRRRVAAIGFSMGAFRAWQLAALSDSVTAAVVDCWMATMQGLMVPGNNQLKGQSAFSMLHPGVGRYLDYPDVAALAAPKPMLFYAGEQDGLFPVASVKTAFGKMHQVWQANGAAGKLETRFWPLGHVFVKEQQDAAFDWLDRQFGTAAAR
ncbi:dienelactone hydrolase family protein [Uliginosibacterium sp. H1]|uniref:dienelactone hydrolase family protein n=1 Tax=Uliginosibacterium sp. H1 TaxID=3114757 RepID=UPI002E18F0E7|nr:alpha/beta hydrolase family protein [Uliginosibacterium sp. H1]